MLDNTPLDFVPEADKATHEKTQRTPSPLQAVRAECLSCCNGSAHEVKLCQSTGCPLVADIWSETARCAARRSRLHQAEVPRLLGRLSV